MNDDDRLRKLLLRATDSAAEQERQLKLKLMHSLFDDESGSPPLEPNRGFARKYRHTRRLSNMVADLTQCGLFVGDQPRLHSFWSRHNRLFTAAASALICVALIGLTEPGRALAARVLDWIVPMRIVTQSTDVLHATCCAMDNYSIQVNDELFERVIETELDVDVIRARSQTDSLPPIQLEINYAPGRAAKQLYADATTADYPHMVDMGALTQPVRGYGMEIYQGTDPNSAMEVRYWLDDGESGAYEFVCRMYLEASQLYRPAMDEMLATFTGTD